LKKKKGGGRSFKRFGKSREPAFLLFCGRNTRGGGEKEGGASEKRGGWAVDPWGGGRLVMKGCRQGSRLTKKKKGEGNCQ